MPPTLMSRLRSIIKFERRVEEPVVQPRQRLILAKFPGAIYAIGDVHGCLEQLERLQDVIISDGEGINGDKLIIMLGDYVDRGPQSASTLDFLMTPLPAGFRRICLAGNHDEMMLAHAQNPHFNDWLSFGGLETLASYGIDPRLYSGLSARNRFSLINSHIPDIHLDFLANLPVLVSVPGVVFSHAGAKPDVHLTEQLDYELMWPVHNYADSDYEKMPLIVHGHTPFASPQVFKHRICVDTGCFATGTLTAVRLEHGAKPLVLQVGAY